MIQLVIATRNKHKFKEIKGIFNLLDKDGKFELLNLNDINNLPVDFDVEEPAMTYEGNAIIKAIVYGQKIDRLILADDSGLEVDELDGRPGIYSARYGGDVSQEKKNEKLLAEMKNIPTDKRLAQFICVMAIYDPQTLKIRTCKGVYKGKILEEVRGGYGFGFDPVFYDLELNKTFAQMLAEEKNSRSHRRQALEEAYKILNSDFV